jgi:hypothetical protein
MVSIPHERDMLEVLKKQHFPGSAARLIALIIHRFGANCLNVLQERKNDYVYSYNDTFMYYHGSHKKFGEVIEICNPYEITQFAFITFSDFKNLIIDLMEGREPELVHSLSIDEKDRMDYDYYEW